MLCRQQDSEPICTTHFTMVSSGLWAMWTSVKDQKCTMTRNVLVTLKVYTAKTASCFADSKIQNPYAQLVSQWFQVVCEQCGQVWKTNSALWLGMCWSHWRYNTAKTASCFADSKIQNPYAQLVSQWFQVVCEQCGQMWKTKSALWLEMCWSHYFSHPWSR